ncbi:MAG: hypothetical protein A3I63_08425 [Betaproteobacteria bacterium RIFCSPLOWO2_02_FULL_66_14]|nr:MAG: hypothetical protein A3I63_08425 [Betaproteobacteria bacterium RIFCSPLOWO2_02_FULL_66_14]
MLGVMVRSAGSPRIHFIVTWPATVMHELSHLLIALVTLARPTGMSVLPRRVDGAIELGRVTVKKANALNASLVALAHLVLLALPYALYAAAIQGRSVDCTTLIPVAFISASALYGSIPSRHDLIVALKRPLGALAIVVFGAIFFAGEAQAMVGRYGEAVAKEAQVLKVNVRAMADKSGLSIAKAIAYNARLEL